MEAWGPGALELCPLFLDRYRLRLEKGVRGCWDNMSGRLPRVETGRSLLPYAFARGRMPREMWSIDVHGRGLNSRADGLHRLRRVTGLDFKVQAVMLTQGDTDCALRDAVEAIDAHLLLEFSFPYRSCQSVLVVAK